MDLTDGLAAVKMDFLPVVFGSYSSNSNVRMIWMFFKP